MLRAELGLEKTTSHVIIRVKLCLLEELLFHALNTRRVNGMMGHSVQAGSQDVMLTRLRVEAQLRVCQLGSE